MNFRKLFKRHSKTPANGGVIISGIKAADWYAIHSVLKAEYANTASSHKKPTEYMRGIAFAIKALETVRPYNIAEVQ